MQKRHFILTLLLFTLAISCSVTEKEEEYPTGLLKSDVFEADPAIIKDCLKGNGKTTLRWNAPGIKRIEIHVEAANGPLFTIAGNNGFKETGYWVKDGMKFVLLNADTGEELATIDVSVRCGS